MDIELQTLKGVNMELNPGTRIRDYEIVRLIGSGGMGEVWLAHETMLDREVAIKRLNFELTRDQQFAARFQNEARIQAKLNHPNIVGMHAFFEEAGQFYMVLEYAPGITLRELIDRTGPIPEQRTLGILNQIAAALGYAHAKGIIHRDVKPSNIMVDPDNQDHVKMMDFGIARLLSEGHLTRTGTRLGTMHYMSPEQVLAEKDIDARSDVYSAGVVLYEMLSGRLPFNADTDSEYLIQHKIVTEEMPDPRDVYAKITESTVSLLQKLTQKKRENRPEGISKAMRNADTDAGTTETPRDPTHKRERQSENLRSDTEDIESHEFESGYDESKPKKSWKSYWYIYLPVFVLLGYLAVQLTNGRLVSPGIQAGTSEEKAQDSLVAPSLRAGTSEVTPPSMIKVSGGSFQMGSIDGKDDEQPVHKVTVSSFWIGKHEVTQAEWYEVMGSNPSSWKGDNLPVEQVSWYDAVDYCNQRSKKEGLTPCYSGSGESITCNWNANGYRLPTEAEWEFAARGGVMSKGYIYSGSNDLGSVAWFNGNSGYQTHSVGGKSANELGIQDMSGNVWEWCWDWYDEGYYAKTPGSDPTGAGSGSYRVLRGGSWDYYGGNYCRVAIRGGNGPDNRNDDYGLRLARAIF